MKKIHVSSLWFLMAAACLAGCETVKGVGRDITGGSETVQKMMTGNTNNKPTRNICLQSPIKIKDK